MNLTALASSLKGRVPAIMLTLALMALAAFPAFAQAPTEVPYDTIAATAKTDIIALLVKVVPAIAAIVVLVAGARMFLRGLRSNVR